MRKIAIPNPGNLKVIYYELRENGYRGRLSTRRMRFGYKYEDVLDVPSIVVKNGRNEFSIIDGHHRAVTAARRNVAIAAYLIEGLPDVRFLPKISTDLDEERLVEIFYFTQDYRDFCKSLGIDIVNDLVKKYR